jgi:hypothetical protein
MFSVAQCLQFAAFPPDSWAQPLDPIFKQELHNTRAVHAEFAGASSMHSLYPISIHMTQWDSVTFL